MSTLISSAVGTSKVAAPKGGARRRQQPPPPSPSAVRAATPSSVASAQASVAPPTPPPTQPAQTLGQPAFEEPQLSAQPRENASLPRASPAAAAATETAASQASQPRKSQDPSVTETTEDVEQSAVPATQPVPSRKRQRDQAVESQPTKRVKKSSARSNARIQDVVNDEGASAGPSTEPQRATRNTRNQNETWTTAVADKAGKAPTSAAKKRAAKRRSDAANADTAVEEGDGEQQPTSARRKSRKEKRPKQPQDQAPANEDGEDQTSEEDNDHEDSDESDPELHEIDPNTVTMWEVGGDKRHGKTSEREKKMAEIDWVEVARKRREAADRVIANATAQVPSSDAVVETTEGPSGTAEPRNATQKSSGPANISGVQFRLVNGQIVEDESSLTIDRQAQAEADAAQTTGAPIEEEDDLTTRINRTTYINDRRREPADRVPMAHRKSDAWSEEETDRFYDALKMFGTDFFIISKMFAPKTRRHIKTKFVREERLDPQRVNDALLGKQTVPMDLEHYAREVGNDVSEYLKYEGVKQAEEVIREGLAEKEEEWRNVIRQEEMLEEARKKEQAERDKARRRGQGKKGKGAAAGATGPKRQRKKKGVDAEAGGVGMNGDAVAGAEE